tara:strand:+ start:1338 stop:1754 length:417 start_codon:yes stop_codon:yes gene_type:complete
MKKIILILILAPLLTFSKSDKAPVDTLSKNTYKEFNLGIAIMDNDFAFPGASFLFGKTNYFSNNTLLDYQLGVAFPSIVTGKIGFGIGNEDFATIIGFRPWPTCPYLQISFKERHNLSVEHGVYTDYVVTLLTYGIRF